MKSRRPSQVVDVVGDFLDDQTEASMAQSAAPIADLFENASVLFADIAGFTGWSSGRDPRHVFHLLETLFGAFDAIAIKRSVFKIETIGDCYLAVTGLPKPQVCCLPRLLKRYNEWSQF